MASWFAINQSWKAINQIMFILISCLWSLFFFLTFFSKRNWKKDSFQNLAQISRKRIQLTNLILVPVTYRCAPPTPPTHTHPIFIDHYRILNLLQSSSQYLRNPDTQFFIRLIMFTLIGQQYQQLHAYVDVSVFISCI